jgi:beta-lactamase class A
VSVTRTLILTMAVSSTMITLCHQDSRGEKKSTNPVSTLPSRFPEGNELSQSLRDIVVELALDGEFPTEDGPERISLAVIDLTGSTLRFGGVYAENFVYPASVYKMYVAAEVLRQISEGKATLETVVTAKDPNVVDRSKEIPSDPRPLLVDGDEVTLGYLLDLMITRSDNTAANCLIDFAQRSKINSLMHEFGWQGSEVTRKFLKRTVEDEGYRDAPGTETCALHAADFLYRIRTRTLVNPWVSMQLESLLGRQLDNAKLAQGLPASAMFYHKTGWYADWSHDVGIVDDGTTCFVVACFLPLKEELAKPKFEELGKRIFALMSPDK